MPWLVQLRGPQDALERLPALMQGQEYTIVRFENGIYLSGSAFDGLSDIDAVRARAEEVCRHLEAILQLYVGLADQFRPGNVLQLSSTGTPRRRNLTASLEARVISSRGLASLTAADHQGSTLTSRILRLAGRDSLVAQVFYIVSYRDISWYEIYDLLDVMGGVDRIVKRRWATRRELSDIRQTANHYRHRGNQRAKHKLPSNPPSLSNSRAVVQQLVERWLAERLASVS